MTGKTGASGNSVSVAKATSLGILSVASLSVLLWIAWPRQQKVVLEQVLTALRRLHEECIAVYADVVTLVPGVLAKSSSKPETLQQAIDQPLVLQAALQAAAKAAAVELRPRASVEDLDAELQRFADEPEVKLRIATLQTVHEACLAGDTEGVLGACSAEVWSREEALAMLRELGHSKAQATRVVISQVGSATKDFEQLGAKLTQVCAQAEEGCWHRFWPGDRRRRCSFLPEVELFSQDKQFQDERGHVERQLEEAALAISVMDSACSSGGRADTS